MMPSRQSLRCAAAAIDKTWLQRLLLEQAEDAVHEDDQIDRQIEIVEAFDDLLARPRDRRERPPLRSGPPRGACITQEKGYV